MHDRGRPAERFEEHRTHLTAVAGNTGGGTVTSGTGSYVIRADELPSGENSSIFNGHERGAQVSFFLSHNRPGTGPKLHRHPYEETFIVEEGDVLFTVGESTVEASAGDIVVVPAGTPHKFLSRGATHRQISIHPVPRMETEWLE